EGSSLPRNLLHPNVRRILNVRYLLWPDLEMGQSLQGAFLSQRTLADGRPYETMFPDDGLPRARLVGSAVVRSDAEAVAYILSDAFDPESEVVLPEAPDLALSGGPVDGAVEWLERTANRHRLSVSSDRPALLAVADNWFPAWRVTLDGAEAPLLRANHALRAVPVPSGESTVEMEYASSVVATSFWISLLLTLGLGGATIFGLLRDRRRGDET